MVKWLREGGRVDALCPDRTNATRETLLHAAAAWGHLEMARELLKRGASVNLPSSTGFTALMLAAQEGHEDVVSLLTQHSPAANPDLRSMDGSTALIMAASKGHEACVQVLLLAKANTELRGKGRTALQHAKQGRHPATAELIRKHACLSGLPSYAYRLPYYPTVVCYRWSPVGLHATMLQWAGLPFTICITIHVTIAITIAFNLPVQRNPVIAMVIAMVIFSPMAMVIAMGIALVTALAYFLCFFAIVIARGVHWVCVFLCFIVIVGRRFWGCVWGWSLRLGLGLRGGQG